MEREVELLGGVNLILSTNIPLRKDGNPYSNFRGIADCGVAVYFSYKDKPMVFASDKWDLVEHNLRSITKTIDAIRGIERWGSSDMLERAFKGFQALPAPVSAAPYKVLGVDRGASYNEYRVARNKLALKYHPDSGTHPNENHMVKINNAYDQIREATND